MAQWYELQLSVPAAQVEAAEAVASMAARGGIYTEDYSDLEAGVRAIARVDLIDEALLAAPRERAVIHLYVSPEDDPEQTVLFLEERLAAAGIAHTLTRGTVEEEDWANNWKQYYKPFPIGRRLYIRPQWEAADERAAGRRVVTLDPGMAFGTGTHETTRLCLTLLEPLVTDATELLDVGCGSGILAIAAAVLGARRADAVDIDPLAVKIARENAALSGVEGKIRFSCGDLAEHAAGPYTLLTANIVADVILRLLPDVPRLLAPGGDFLASGVIDSREADVADGIRRAGLTLVETLRDGGWVAFRARR